MYCVKGHYFITLHPVCCLYFSSFVIKTLNFHDFDLILIFYMVTPHFFVHLQCSIHLSTIECFNMVMEKALKGMFRQTEKLSCFVISL